MIVDRYAPLDLFALLPELRLEMEPELRELDGLLEDDELFGRVKADLCQRYPNSATLGRRSTPVEVILRMLVVKRLYDFSYEECERLVSDSITLRQFCRLYLELAPDDGSTRDSTKAGTCPTSILPPTVAGAKPARPAAAFAGAQRTRCPGCAETVDVRDIPEADDEIGM